MNCIIHETYLSSRQESSKLAQSDGQVVENVAHPVVSSNHGTLAETLERLGDQRAVVGAVERVAEGGNDGSPDQREEVVVKDTRGCVHESTFGRFAPSQQHFPLVVFSDQTRVFCWHDDLFIAGRTGKKNSVN